MRPLECSALLFLAGSIFTCTSKKEQTDNIVGDQTIRDSISNAIVKEEKMIDERDLFIGEYLIGDEGSFIVPVGDTYEMRNSEGDKTDIIYFQGREKDTITIYANKDKSIIFKMNPGHKVGVYYEPDEQWPVHYIGLIREEETEEEESERVFKQRHIEDSIAYTQLGIYDGNYLIYTESEGIDASLNLLYNGDQTFKYDWRFAVSNEEANCERNMEGTLVMDRTQHGFDRQGECFIHFNFNFNGYGSEGYVVEIDFEDQAKCLNVKGECTFSATYVKK